MARNVASQLGISNPEVAFRTASAFTTATIGSLDKESLKKLKKDVGQEDVPMSVFKKNVTKSARESIYAKK